MEENKFNNSKVYKIVCRLTGLIYIGSTTKTLDQRLSKHKSDYQCYLTGTSHYITSFEIIKNDNYYIKKIKSYNFENHNDLLKKERYWNEKYICVNKNRPIISKDEKIEYFKEYYQENKIEKIFKQKEYYLKNKDKISVKQKECVLCVCGCNYRKNHKARHQKSTKHLKLVAQI